MRKLRIGFMVFVLTTTAAGSLHAVAAGQPVSDRVFDAAAQDQRTLAVASSGETGFAVWFDQRDLTTDLYGSRIDSTGASLDPLGILLARGATGGSVVWNGSAFVIVTERGPEETLLFLTSDGRIADRKVLPLSGYHVVASTTSGPSVRLLFVNYEGNAGAIVDGSGNLIVSNVTLCCGSPTAVIAAGSTSEFVVVHSGFVSVVVERIDRDGNRLSSNDLGLSLAEIGTSAAIAGASDGYLLVARGNTRQAVTAYHLGPTGLYTGVKETLEPLDSTFRLTYPAPAAPKVVREGARYIVAWTTSPANGSAYAAVAEVPASGGAPVVQHIDEWRGMGYGIGYASAGAQRIVVSDRFRDGAATSIDPFVQTLGTSLDNASPPHLLASSATLQRAPQIASTAGGYAVTWNELGPDGAGRLYIRRFSLAGVPLDSSAIEVAPTDLPLPVIRLAAGGATYVVAWSAASYGAPAQFFLRRLSAATGAWLDAAPVPVAVAYDLVLSSNGKDALAAYTVGTLSLLTRRIALDPGPPLPSPEVVTNQTYVSQLAIATNGADYLLAWADPSCPFWTWCDVLSAYDVLALRVRGDGTPLDSGPYVLESKGYASPPSVAWGSGRYVVGWLDGNFHVARITPGGELDRREISYSLGHNDGTSVQRVTASGGAVVLLARRTIAAGLTTWFEAVIPDGDSAPAALITLIDEAESDTVAVAGTPGGIGLAYIHGDPEGGNAARVFSRPSASAARRRAAR